jgi:hypothetical protein
MTVIPQCEKNKKSGRAFPVCRSFTLPLGGPQSRVRRGGQLGTISARAFLNQDFGYIDRSLFRRRVLSYLFSHIERRKYSFFFQQAH